MKKTSVEISVGIFVVIGLLCVAYLTIKLGKMELLGNGYYHVTAKFASVSGLKKGAVVDIAGVQVGQVERIDLQAPEMAALVRMKIRDHIQLTDDVIASVKTSGLIGDKYVRLEPGGSAMLLKDGGLITETESAIDLESVISKYAFGDVGKPKGDGTQ
jgi:phospholipid/cholesterol/gamma-HCH transport system substrate-binding protein